MTETRQQRRARERADAKRTRDRGYQKGEVKRTLNERDAEPQLDGYAKHTFNEPTQSNPPKSSQWAEPADVPKPRLVMPGGAMIGLAMAALMGGY